MNIIIINGKPKVGKDKFIEIFQSSVNNEVHNISSVDLIKEVYRMLGKNYEPTPEDRKNISDLKDWATDRLDAPFKYIINQVSKVATPNDIVFIHVREPGEIQKLKNYYAQFEDIECNAVLLDRVDYKPDTNNHADEKVYDYRYDKIVVMQTVKDVDTEVLYHVKELIKWLEL
jgi:hypothetical protein